MKLIKFLGYSVVIMSLFIFSASAVDTPTSVEGVKIVTVAEVAAIQSGGGIIVDARPKMEYLEGHIPGSIHIAYKDRGKKEVNFDDSKDKFKLKKLEKAAKGNKAAKIVFYCNGVPCWQSYKASIWANRKGGFTAVHWFRGGLPDWKAAGKSIKSGE